MARIPLQIPFLIGAVEVEPVDDPFDGPGGSVWVAELPSSMWVL